MQHLCSFSHDSLLLNMNYAYVAHFVLTTLRSILVIHVALSHATKILIFCC